MRACLRCEGAVDWTDEAVRCLVCGWMAYNPDWIRRRSGDGTEVPERMQGPSTGSCAQCRYWMLRGGEQGDCRRYPPRVVVTPTGTMTVWPRTFATAGCGEYAPWRAGPSATKRAR